MASRLNVIVENQDGEVTKEAKNNHYGHRSFFFPWEDKKSISHGDKKEVMIHNLLAAQRVYK